MTNITQRVDAAVNSALSEKRLVGAVIAVIAASPPLVSAGKNLTVETPSSMARITSTTKKALAKLKYNACRMEVADVGRANHTCCWVLTCRGW